MINDKLFDDAERDLILVAAERVGVWTPILNCDKCQREFIERALEPMLPEFDTDSFGDVGDSLAPLMAMTGNEEDRYRTYKISPLCADCEVEILLDSSLVEEGGRPQ